MERLGYRPALDGLRAFAVLAVITMHSWQAVLPGGTVGVDLFFVLSGFLITTLLLDEWRATGGVHLGRFYARRALRLLPALAVLMPTSILAAALFSPGLLHNTLAEAGSAAAYFSNWIVPTEGANTGLLAHTWSLAVEEQYYLIWPVALWLMLRLGGPRFTLRATLVLIAVVAAQRAATWHGQAGAYYHTDTRADALLVGAALALAICSGQLRLGVGAARISGALGGVALALVAVAYQAPTIGWGPMALGGFTVVALAGAALIAGVVVSPPRVLSARPLVFIGRVSYGLYLWHYPIEKLLQDRVGSGAVCLALTLVLTFAVATVSYRYLERPFLRLKPRAATPQPAVAPASVPVAA